MKSSFFDDLDDQESKSNSSVFFSDLDEKPKKKRSSIKGIIESPGRGFGSQLLGLPRSITGLIKHGSNALARKGRELAEMEGRDISEDESSFTSAVTAALSSPDELLERIGFMTPEEISSLWRSISEGVPQEELEDLSGIERGLETAGSVLGGGLNPSRAFTKSGLLASAGAGAASSLGGESGAQIAGALTLPALAHAIQLIKTGKLSPSGSEAKALYEFGKSKGLSDAELTPILQSRGRKKILGGIAQPTERAASAVKRSETALGSIYDDLKSQASKSPLANTRQEGKFLIKMDKIVSELEKSKLPPDAKKQVLEKIKSFMGDVVENGIGTDEIISTWQDINDTVNWGSFKTGKKALAALKEPMSELFKDLSPSQYKEFETVNKLYGRLQDTAKKIRPTDSTKFVKYGEVGALISGIHQLATTGHPGVLTTLATQKGARLLATEMLTNPRLNNIVNKALASATKGTKQAAIKAARDFERDLREFPEIHEEFDFPQE